MQEHTHDPQTTITAFGREWWMNCQEVHTEVRIREISLAEIAIYKEFQDEFRKIHYEPEHEDGVTCWCGPVSTVVKGVHHIDHREQRTLLRNLFWTFMLKYSALRDEQS